MTSDFGFTCPAGGRWYACGENTESRFVGCCTSNDDVCSKGCNDGNLKSGGFNASMHGKFPDASCGAQSRFYSCVGAANSTFWGCCKVDACKAGAKCPEGDLAGAFLDRPNMFSVYAPSQSTPSPSSSPPPSNEPKTSNGAIIGGAVGGAVVVALIIGVGIFLLCRRRRRNQHQSSGEVVGAVTASTPMMNEKSNHRRNISESYGMQSPPPMYASPNPDVYQNGFDPRNSYHTQPYQKFAYAADGPSELPTEYSTAGAAQRYSELPAEVSSSSKQQRTSELPADATAIASELESPQVTPRPLQSEFSRDLTKASREDASSTPSTKKV